MGLPRPAGHCFEEKMKASALEFRFRALIHALIFLIGFTAPWNYALHWDSVRSWQFCAAWLARWGVLGFSAATVAVLVVGILFALAAALLRTWAAAWLGTGVVQSAAMHGAGVVCDGPYRFLRNPLYVGVMLHTVALALLMPPSGAVFCLAAIVVFELRLAGAEESFLGGRLGQAYGDYCAKMPRWLPAFRPRVAASGARAQWGTAFVAEIYFWGVFVSFAALGWGYNAVRIIQGVLVSAGVAMIVRALLPRAVRADE